jgi:hypothetical protein
MTLAPTIVSPEQLPPAPRPINPRASRRSWSEAPVRIWAILSVIVLLAAVYFTTTRVSAALTTRRLVTRGSKVIAVVDSANGVKDLGRKYDRRDRNTCDLTYTGPDGVKRTVQQELSPQPGILEIGKTIELRVDPEHPTVFTDQLEPPPWRSELSALIVPLPLLAFSVLMMWWRRSRVLAVWRHGEPVNAIVVDSKQSATAPLSRVVRFALADGEDRRVFHLLYPTRAGELSKGDPLLLLAPKANPARAIAASLYV